MASKTVNGLFWSSMERISVQGAQFVLSLFIARILSPSDYGLVAMLGIFMAVAQTFVDSGFSNALIQKQGRTDVDYSTVFFFKPERSMAFPSSRPRMPSVAGAISGVPLRMALQKFSMMSRC